MTSRIFCAVDTADFNIARNLAKGLAGHIAGLKLGLEFFSSHGPQGYKAIAMQGPPVFLDLKFKDIPNTVAGAVTALLPLRPDFISIHASGGPAMIKAAAEAAAEGGADRPKILAVTVLTSLNNDDLTVLGIPDGPAAHALRLARLAKDAGADGVISSPAEVAVLREACGKDFVLMVPGIRPIGSDKGDQKRVMTPKDAVAAGADYVVIGRPITGAPDPLAMAKAINSQIES